MSHKIFMNLLRFWNYHEFLKCLLKKFVFVIKCTLKLWMFFTVCVNYNEKHNGGWKSSDLLKLVFHISFFVWWNFFLCLIQNYQEFQSCVAMLYMLLILYAYVKCWNTFLFFIYYSYLEHHTTSSYSSRINFLITRQMYCIFDEMWLVQGKKRHMQKWRFHKYYVVDVRLENSDWIPYYKNGCSFHFPMMT
jgi:hypothetical protein